ncbi:hypothetical protein CISG_08384 [Coccidioides immitis RMSCC 3703]|uniref:Uncharacterized protein n=1 Tax=Coccidioides immitis RMSCC 3703 TaxID=454286 RepID=A0A0J8U1H4_COCIT|nr:hypothetical protein CISG_08384 [Coccidioides immitis RMSCC 3703]
MLPGPLYHSAAEAASNLHLPLHRMPTSIFVLVRARGDRTLSVKAGCLIGLSKELMKDAVHIWCKEAVTEIPDGVERFEEEPGWRVSAVTQPSFVGLWACMVDKHANNMLLN